MLEDEFVDVFRKARRGAGLDEAALAVATGLDANDLRAWGRGEGAPPNDAQARAIARVLRLDPGKFADAAATRWHPDVHLPYDVRHHPQDPHPSNGYLFFLENGRTAALVDPAGNPENLLRAIGPVDLRYILITHKHADHCDATADVARAFPQAKIVMHALDIAAIGPLGDGALRVRDGETIPFGDTAEIRMLHTPGHTDGSSSYVFKSNVFTGDTLFAGSVGGVFGPTATYDDLLASIRFKLFTLPDDTVVAPGHGPPSTIGEEKAHNPFFP